MPSTSTAQKLIVQKFGGATLSTPEKIRAVAERIAAQRKSGVSVVAVVSAMGQTTNQLIELAKQVSNNPSLREMDMLMSVGERISMSLLSMALNDLGCEAISFTGSQAGILTDDDHISANILDVKPIRVAPALAAGKVVVLAGFQGVSAKTKEITTLGRGGSDITAVAVAQALGADRCEILKDVDSIFSADPNIVTDAQPIRELSAQLLFEMTCWGVKVVNYRSAERFLKFSPKNLELYIGPAHAVGLGTVIRNETQNSKEPSSALSVNLVKEAWLIHTSQLSHMTLNGFQVLTKANETETWITAPSEVLDLHRLSTIVKKSNAIVTVTFANSILNPANLPQSVKNQISEFHSLGEVVPTSDLYPHSAHVAVLQLSAQAKMIQAHKILFK